MEFSYQAPDTKIESIETYNNWDLEKLITFIGTEYHQKIEADINDLMPHIDKVVRVHGESHPHLPAVRNLFLQLVAELKVHTQKEVMVFDLIDDIKSNVDILEFEISSLAGNHIAFESVLENISELTHTFTAPAGSCKTYNIVYDSLRSFNEKLTNYRELETKVLFEKIKA
ncbi:hemerythrin domain-containing protein [Ancylomarina sp. YFZ004]